MSMMTTAKVMLDLHRSLCNLQPIKEKNPSQAGAITKAEIPLVIADAELQQQSQKLFAITELKQADTSFKSAQEQIRSIDAKTKKALLTESFIGKYDGVVKRLDTADAKHKTLIDAINQLIQLKVAVANELVNKLNSGASPAATLRDIQDSTIPIKDANKKITPERTTLEMEGKAIADAATKVTADVEIAYKSGSRVSPSTEAAPTVDNTGPGASNA